jgi:dTDP-4-dehydrorhamnose reductase
MIGNWQAGSRGTVLVTGASGFLGWHVCEAAKADWDVVGTCCAHPVSIDDVDMRAVDFSNTSALAGFLADLSPDAVIHAAALSQPNACEESPELSQAVNVNATRCVATWCEQSNVPLVFTSSDLVFDGLDAPYDEAAATCPVSLYGRHKVEAERAVLDCASRGVVCRLPLMFGDRDGAPASFLGPHLQALREGMELNLFVDEYRTPVSGEVAAKGLLLALESNAVGILHLGGSERISRYELGILVSKVFGLSIGGIIPVRQSEIKMAAPRPPDVSLDSRKACALGYTTGTIVEQLVSVRDQMKQR